MAKYLSAALVGALFFGAVPASAAQWLVLGNGVIIQSLTNPPGTTRLELPMLAGQFVSFGFVIDDSFAGVDVPPPGGVGAARSYTSAVTGFGMQIGDSIVTRPDDGPAQMFILNDVRGPTGPDSRRDQVTMNMGVVFEAGVPRLPLETDFPLPENVFFSTLAFGRVMDGTIFDPPQLVDSAAIPALEMVWTFGSPMFFSFQMREGNPTSPQELVQLPVGFFNVSQLNFQVFPIASEVPEPASWALFIAGFGLVGGALRRRTALRQG